MRVLITGAQGQLGRDLTRHLGRGHHVDAPPESRLDVTDPGSVRACVRDAAPDAVVHTAAMTAVDECETHVEQACLVNALGSRNVAAACREFGAWVVAISTDFVFPGDSARPYREIDPTGPINVYGQTKLAGEDFVRQQCPDHVIVRTAWLYGPGGKHFVETILRLAERKADAGEPLRVVADQTGSPTSTTALCRQIARILEDLRPGTVHAACHGQATRFEWAKAALELAGLTTPIEPCPSSEFPLPAPRPVSSALDNMVLRLDGLDVMPDWRDALREFVQEEGVEPT